MSTPRLIPLLATIAITITVPAKHILSANAENTAAHHAALISITDKELKRHVDVLADDSFEGRAAGSRGGQAASGYLRTELAELGIEPLGTDGDYFQYFRGGWRNLIARIPGTDPALKDQYILIGAHYDHVGYGNNRTSYGPTGYIHNGADDNASGTSVLLEVAQALQMIENRRSMLIVFWDGEEQGLLGSKHFVRNPSVPLEQIRLSINMDMVGRLRDERLTVFGTRTLSGSRRLISEQNLSPTLTIDFDWENKPNSDHHPFFIRNIPYLMPHTGLHDDYHRPRDDAHKINAQGMEQVGRLLFRIIRQIDQQDEISGFRSLARREYPRHQRILERPTPAPVKRLGLAWKSSAASDSGLLVTRIQYGSPASEAGIQTGDRITEFDGQLIDSDVSMRAAVFAAPATSQVIVTRSDQEQPLELDIQLRGEPMRLGLSWRTDEAEPEAGLVSRVIAGSPAAAAGLRVSDRIYAVNSRRWGDPEQMQDQLVSATLPLTLLVERDGLLETITLGVFGENLQAANSR
jgi:hypothetical protein